MRYDPEIHHRRSIRLKGYDYAAPGAYFVTICIHGRECLLGEVAGGTMLVGPAGEAVRSAWEELPGHYPRLRLDAFAVMPNHIHGILVLHDHPGANTDTPATAPVTEIVRAFKSFSARR